MNTPEKTNEKPTGDSDLFKAVKLLEENGFYVISAETKQHEVSVPLVIKMYPKRFVETK